MDTSHNDRLTLLQVISEQQAEALIELHRDLTRIQVRLKAETDRLDAYEERLQRLEQREGV
jgi:allophanate hydrolase subunit 1